MLKAWPPHKKAASVKELRSLTGNLLYFCDVVRPGKFFTRRSEQNIPKAWQIR